jgi:hypothetical protein
MIRPQFRLSVPAGTIQTIHHFMSKTDNPPNSQAAHAVFSFFSGAGFLDLGFEKSGFEIAFANELNAEFVEGYRHSRMKMGLIPV